MTTLKRYKQNLKVVNNKVYSYDTLVAKIKGDTIKKVKWKVWVKGDILDKEITTSPTTSKHINYVAQELNLELI